MTTNPFMCPDGLDVELVDRKPASPVHKTIGGVRVNGQPIAVSTERDITITTGWSTATTIRLTLLASSVTSVDNPDHIPDPGSRNPLEIGTFSYEKLPAIAFVYANGRPRDITVAGISIGKWVSVETAHSVDQVGDDLYFVTLPFFVRSVATPAENRGGIPYARSKS